MSTQRITFLSFPSIPSESIVLQLAPHLFSRHNDSSLHFLGVFIVPTILLPLVADSAYTGQTGSPVMQVVSCRVNEGLVIDHEISVTVLDVQETHVRLGISSPNQTPSYREETLFCESAEPAAELQLQ